MIFWAGWVALGATTAWLRWPVAPWLWIVGLALALGLIRRGPLGVRPRLALLPLLVALVVAAVTQGRLDRASETWSAFWQEQEERAGVALKEQMEALISSADAGVERAARAQPLENELDAIRRGAGLSALALYDAQGRPEGWAGEHFGPIPEAARDRQDGYAYAESPLFGYVYFVRPRETGGGVVLGAVLLQSDLPAALASSDRRDFVARFQRDTGEEVRISQVERVQGPGVWDFQWEAETLFSMQIVRPSQADRRRALRAVGSRWVFGLGALSFLLLLRARPPGRRAAGVAIGVTTVAALLPFEPLLGPLSLFSPADFLLPGPLPLSLGRILVVGAAALVLLGLRRSPNRTWGPLPVVVAVACGLPALYAWIRSGSSVSILAASETGWLIYTMALALAAAAFLLACLRWGRVRGEAPFRPVWVGLSLVAAGALAVWLSGRVLAGEPIPPLLLGIWAVPAACLAWALGSGRGRQEAGYRVAGAALLAISAVAPASWGQRTQARMEVTTAELQQLGSQADPYLEFLLDRLGEELLRVQLEVTRPIELLYEAWESSGLAEVGVPLWLTLWTPANAQRERLPIGVGEAAPRLEPAYLDGVRARGTASVIRVDEPDQLYLATYPLRDGFVGSATVPPRRDVSNTSPLGPLFSSVERATSSPLSLVPIDTPGGGGDGSVRWSAGVNALNGERDTRFPEGWYRARYQIALPGPLLLVARGSLLFALVSAVVGALYLIGRSARPTESGASPLMHGGFRESFRGRLTMALLGFFLLSTLVIATLMFQTLARSAERTAEALAARVALEASEAFIAPERLGPLARQIGADLIYYEDGALARGAVHELVELGIYPAWLPMSVHEALEGGRTVTASASGVLGSWQFVMAYQSVGAGQVLASPASLQVGANAVRRRETVDLLGFTILLGGALSLALALWVGRTLTSPLETLQGASGRVGSGDLDTRLPDDRRDEFGSVFEAFNEMVSGLGTARSALERTTRRTQAIVEEAATGVIALDPDRKVVLVNPRAEAILETDLVPGESLPETGGDRVVGFGEWVSRFFADGLPEGTTEFNFGERRVRARGRRISRAEPLGGAVFALADVTDEMRAERVLAWGEMARQIAHEVKNPLTPIKLSVQHIQRAWDDEVEDYGTVLDRNVGAILGEIDRLAQIAGSFSRLSAPDEEARSDPLEPVDLASLVGEVLALYETTDRGIQFRSSVGPGLEVWCRGSELKEVLLNLLENARDAVAERGLVRIEATGGGDGAELRVVDDGRGIPPADLARIFEPHFSTRSKGTGLGLAIVRRLVESWGGTVSAQSEVGVGTTMTVSLRRVGPSSDTGQGGQEQPG